MMRITMSSANTHPLLLAYPALKKWIIHLLETHHVPQLAAEQLAEVLIVADMRGIASHGVAHLPRHLADIATGLTQLNTQPQTICQLPAIESWDAQHALGAVTSIQAMNCAINKAKLYGVGAVAVKNSCHHGISSYYALQALQHNMIGLALTNTAALGVPTFGTQARFGTNPIAFAAPAHKLPPFVLDMSTTVVTRGSFEMAIHNGYPIPEGWAVDKNGQTPADPLAFLDDLLSFKGGLLPLGGSGLTHGGHKGYGLAIMVDILSSLLAGGSFGVQVTDTKETAASVNHFFMAINVTALRPIETFKADMDSMLTTLIETKPIAGVESVVYAGLKAHDSEQKARSEGVPINPSVYTMLQQLAQKHQLPLPTPL
jgi:L-2-hydroxycarboxylate dehydrogenase (NAD+)